MSLQPNDRRRRITLKDVFSPECLKGGSATSSGLYALFPNGCAGCRYHQCEVGAGLPAGDLEALWTHQFALEEGHIVPETLIKESNAPYMKDFLSDLRSLLDRPGIPDTLRLHFENFLLKQHLEPHDDIKNLTLVCRHCNHPHDKPLDDYRLYLQSVAGRGLLARWLIDRVRIMLEWRNGCSTESGLHSLTSWQLGVLWSFPSCLCHYSSFVDIVGSGAYPHLETLRRGQPDEEKCFAGYAYARLLASCERDDHPETKTFRSLAKAQNLETNQVLWLAKHFMQGHLRHVLSKCIGNNFPNQLQRSFRSLKEHRDNPQAAYAYAFSSFVRTLALHICRHSIASSVVNAVLIVRGDQKICRRDWAQTAAFYTSLFDVIKHSLDAYATPLRILLSAGRAKAKSVIRKMSEQVTSPIQVWSQQTQLHTPPNAVDVLDKIVKTTLASANEMCRQLSEQADKDLRREFEATIGETRVSLDIE